MASEYVKVGSGEDTFGRYWEVGTRGGCLVLTVSPAAVKLHLGDGDGGREKFAEAVARAAMPGQAARAAKPGEGS